MKSSIRYYASVAVFMFLGLAVAYGKPDVTISYDPTKPSIELGPVWLSYCIGRLSYALKHRDEYPKMTGKEWVPLLEEEVDGRFVGLDTYRRLRKAGKIGADRYWEDVGAVFDAGYQNEYVWTFFRRKSWSDEKAPAKLVPFGSWRAEHIPNHKPYTNGGIIIKNG